MVESKQELVESYRRGSIEDAALRVIARDGLARATMQAIAEQAGVAKGTLYLYYRNREELLERAAHCAFTELVTRLQAVLAQPRPLAERLRELVLTKIEFFDAHQEFFRVYMATRHPEEQSERARHRRRRRPQYALYLERLTAFFAEGMRAGEIRGMDPTRLALFFAEGVAGLVLRRLSESPPPAEQEVDWLVDLLLHGLSTSRRQE
jgi:AcrR family transcriptional regulator